MFLFFIFLNIKFYQMFGQTSIYIYNFKKHEKWF